MKMDAYLETAYIIGWIFTITVTLLHLFLRDKAPRNPKFKATIQKMIDDGFNDIDAEKKKYQGNWTFVEEWKKQMRSTADRIIFLYQKEGQTNRVWKAAKTLDQDLLTGLDLIQDGKNPLINFSLINFDHDDNKGVEK